MAESGSNFLKQEPIIDILRPGGALSSAIKGYEARTSQMQMTADVIDAYNNKQIALIEAGTGTGKSVAYLIPALIWAASNKERTVISTHTITLQEQLLYKDIPFLLKVLKLDLKVMLVKGMNNYLCLRKFEDVLLEKPCFSLEEQKEVDQLDLWKENSKDGSKADLPFMPSNAMWDHVSADSDACSHVECPHYKECHFFKARREAADAHILIVNHHLLCADLISRKEAANGAGGIFPSYDRVVIDEAHHLEDVATEYFANKITRLDIIKQLSRLGSEKKGTERLSKLAFLRNKVQESFQSPNENVMSIINRLDIDLPGTRQLITHLVHDLFQAVLFFFNHLENNNLEEGIDAKWRLLKEHLKHPLWITEVAVKAKMLIGELKRYVIALSSLEADLQGMDNDKLNEKTKSTRLDIHAIASRLKKMTFDIEEFVSEEDFSNQVKWMEMRSFKTVTNMLFATADLNISKLLQEMLFNAFSTVILCSATLATNKSFHFIKKRFGLNEVNKKVIEKIYDSPFNYEEQALLVIPKDIPGPTDPQFIVKASEHIWNAIQASQGHAFVLFTSFQMLKACHQILKARLELGRFPVLVQGEGFRQTLLKSFKETKYAVLFGTDSFWEGVDVVGDALRCVIIVKLPFKVPSEPMIQARSELITSEGGDPFMDYSVPSAIVKFKQGFGRLIRNRQDRGCVVCLDARILNKGYGKLFLQSLPKCGTFFEEGAKMQETMKSFYKRKWHKGQVV